MGITELPKSQGSRKVAVTSCYVRCPKKVSVPCNQKAQSVSIYLSTYMTLALPWQGDGVLVRVVLFLKARVEQNWHLKSMGLVMPLLGHVTLSSLTQLFHLNGQIPTVQLQTAITKAT